MGDDKMDRSELSDAQLLDALAFSGSEVFRRLHDRYSWADADPTLVRAAIAIELPESAICCALHPPSDLKETPPHG